MKTALLVGATGLIGNHLLKLLMQDDFYDRVLVLTRKPISVSGKVENRVVSFDAVQDFVSEPIADVFCCLGTTMRVAGSKEAFRKVDFLYPLQIAENSKQLGADRYFLVSALGADKKSSVFYNRVKGEVEESISNLRFGTLHIFRPSLLLGDRTETRTGEDAGKIFFKIFGFLVPAKWKAIEGKKVALAMLNAAKTHGTGVVVHESVEMQAS